MKNVELTDSDLSVCFLEAFDMIFPAYLDVERYPAVFRQNIIYCFTMTVQILLG